MTDEDRDQLRSTVNEALDWLDDHPGASTEEYELKLNEVEQASNQIRRELQSAKANQACQERGVSSSIPPTPSSYLVLSLEESNFS